MRVVINPFVFRISGETPQVLLTDGGQLPEVPYEPDEHTNAERYVSSYLDTNYRIKAAQVHQAHMATSTWRQEKSQQCGLSFLILTKSRNSKKGQWVNLYDLLPWEDWREGEPGICMSTITPQLSRWQEQEWAQKEQSSRQLECNVLFAQGAHQWLERLAHERYRLLFKAGLLEEAHLAHDICDKKCPMIERADMDSSLLKSQAKRMGQALPKDNRLHIAFALTRLRELLLSTPVLTHLTSSTFTLTRLQKTVEAISGINMHKNNFRRLLHNMDIIEETDEMVSPVRGRPAQLFKFKDDLDRSAPLSGLGHLPRSVA